MELIKKAKWAYITISAIMILLGVLLICYPQLSLLTVCTVIGVMVTVFGVVKLIGYFSKDLFRLAFQFDFALGIFALISGVLMLLHPAGIMQIVPVLIGMTVLIDGSFKLQTALDAKRFGLRSWWGILLLAILTCAGGLFLMLNPFDGAAALMILLGATLIIDGVQNVLVVACTVRASRQDHTDGWVA